MESYLMFYNGHPRRIILHIYPYLPKVDQPCFNNSYNPFVVENETRRLLREAKNLNKYSRPIPFKVISNNSEYDEKGFLNWFEGEFVFLNKAMQIPLGLKVSIRNVLDNKDSLSFTGTIEIKEAHREPSENDQLKTTLDRKLNIILAWK